MCTAARQLTFRFPGGIFANHSPYSVRVHTLNTDYSNQVILQLDISKTCWIFQNLIQANFTLIAFQHITNCIEESFLLCTLYTCMYAHFCTYTLLIHWINQNSWISSIKRAVSRRKAVHMISDKIPKFNLRNFLQDRWLATLIHSLLVSCERNYPNEWTRLICENTRSDYFFHVWFISSKYFLCGLPPSVPNNRS